ncbi:unnamed protein product [Psylliodes chrysocephalus]|uniref:C-type lectin domain-containing protein n=1 Tax=Psylliodes chrysocephalus TaxID=3402493 RepID=A0A9P0D3Y8_9CUCU|nr:unnamed protein product [Psylliodes chrysocephala]
MLQVKCFVLFCALFLYTTCEGGVFKEYDSNQSRDEKSNYYLSTEKVSYYDAVQMCHEKDMQLVSIETYDKNKKIFKFLNGSINESFWSSGLRFSESGRLGWLKGECFDYDNLKSSSYSNRCIEVSKTLNELVWNMQNCDQALRFICEKLKKEVTNPKCEDYSEDLVHGNTLQNKKYYIGRETITNSKALQVCRSMCMRLVSIESNEKNQDLYEAIVADISIWFFDLEPHLNLCPVVITTWRRSSK